MPLIRLEIRNDGYCLGMNHFSLLLLAPALMAFQAHAADLQNSTEIEITKTWSQEPGGWAYPISIYVPDGEPPEGGYPVCILLHGNGGQGQGMVNQFRNKIDDHALVAPSGYANSWNICGENSDAPDVEMINDLIEQLQEFDNVNADAIRILGFSNGSALANSVFIQNQNPGLDTVCGVVSQLSDAQYHDEAFHQPSGATQQSLPFCGYDEVVEPSGICRYLGITNSNDPVIPYQGGWSPVGVAFIDSQIAAWVMASSQGYTGKPITGDGTPIGDEVYEYAYLGNQVVHIRGNASHGMNTRQEEYLLDFLSEWPIVISECFSDLNGDGMVDGGDIGLMVAAWDTDKFDLNGDGTTDGGDLGLLLLDWGKCD